VHILDHENGECRNLTELLQQRGVEPITFSLGTTEPEQIAAQLTRDLEQRPERGRRKEAITRCPKPARTANLARELLEQHGFADAGLARDEHEPAPAVICLARVLMQGSQLTLPLDQPHP
jgi:hypothetical protein